MRIYWFRYALVSTVLLLDVVSFTDIWPIQIFGFIRSLYGYLDYYVFSWFLTLGWKRNLIC